MARRNKTLAKELLPFVEPLTDVQRLFVLAKLEGMTDVAAATAAGISNPKSRAYQIAKHPAVIEALKKGIEILATEVMFTRRHAHELLLDAHRNAANTTEQVMAIREMIKLHGVAAPEVKELHTTVKGEIEHREVRELTDEQLLQLAQLPTNRLPQIVDGEYEVLEDDQGKDGGAKSGEGSFEKEAPGPKE